MNQTPTEQPPAPRSDRLRRRRVHRWRRRALVGLAVAVVVGLVAGVYSVVRLGGNITRLDVSHQLGTDRPTPTTAAGGARAMNLLVMGSDDRLGLDTTRYGKDTIEGGAHSDTNLLVHLSADRTWAMVVSIPRDSMVRSPKDCKDPAGTVAAGVVRQWNHNFTDGGPGCVIRTLEGNTGVFVDHFVVVDFNGFRDMVDALGGVEVCLRQDVVDKDSQFRLSAGRHRVDGTTALGYVRVRHALGDGSDLGRIKRQQAFLSSVVQQATRTSILLRPDKLFGFLDAATRAMTTDQDMSVGSLRSIAQSVAGIGLRNITFFTVPTEPYAPDPNRVQWTAAADQLWAAVREDRPVGTPATGATPPGPLTISPDAVTVRVANDSGVGGLAAQAAAALRAQGFSADAVSGVPGPVGVTIRHAASRAEAARTVAAAFPGARLVVDGSVGSAVVVHLGAGAPRVVEVPNRVGSGPLPAQPITAPAPTATPTGRTAAADICE